MQRILEDEELRQSIRDAFDAAKHAYARMSNGKGPASALIDDKKVHRDIKEAAESIRDASQQIRGKRRRRGGGIGRWIAAAVVGAGLVLVLSEGARKAVLDQLFGAEEEFEYTSTTTPEQETVPSS
ncbi:MAG: hypothetical protein ABR536_03830 [Solirubrobacterales bacterium]